MEILSHDKLENGDYVIELKTADGDFLSYTWGPVALNDKGKPSMTEKQYTAMRVREATALAELTT